MNQKKVPSQAQKDFSFALMIATGVHVDQYDFAGDPYILHPIAVALKMDSIEEKTVAILHDVIEDTDITLEDLVEFKFHPDIIVAVDAITWRQDEEYEEYIYRVKTNDLATKVKIADLEHNMDATRLQRFGKYEAERMIKYWKARQELK